ncbi:ion channel [Prosthecomicrobium sp. N25]|uniref:ion channel n=1 Tax=Prosthecomicrobium sp. N25 TaxID=3129254 RepID=UPI0030784DCD
MNLKLRIRDLYEGDGEAAHRFRLGIVLFDFSTIAFIVATSFLPRGPWIEVVDLAIGLLILLEVAARLWISQNRLRDLLHPLGLVDMVVVVSLLAPLAGEGLAFLRIARTLRLFRSYKLIERLRGDFAFVRDNRAALMSGLDLLVFIFLMTAIVYETQHRSNPKIENYADALYFTVTTLTTTGFGDITLEGTGGRLLSVVIMIFGVSLFVRLAQVMFRPNKVDFECPDCGLLQHDIDAVHCKHCGRLLKIPNEGFE